MAGQSEGRLHTCVNVSIQVFWDYKQILAIFVVCCHSVIKPNINMLIDILSLGCYKRLSFTIYEKVMLAADYNMKRYLHPTPLTHSIHSCWVNERTNYINKLNWRQIFPCQYIYVHSIYIFIKKTKKTF